MRLVIYGLLGAVLGFIGMYAALSFRFDMDFTTIAFPVNIGFILITILFVLYAGASLKQLRKNAGITAEGAEEDDRQIWLYKKFSDANMVASASLVLGIAATAIALITKQETWLALLSISVVLVTLLLSAAVPRQYKSVYPERKLPSLSDKDYGKKLLAASDEGERHVMLEGLYRSFNTLNSALVFALILLIGYSMVTGVSQLFAIFVIGFVLIGGNTRYFLAIRNKS